MNTKIYSAVAAALLLPSFCIFAKGETSPENNVSGAAGVSDEKKSAVARELQNHFGLYGFIRNYFAYDSREGASGTGNLFYYLPFDKEMSADGKDLNSRSSFRFLSLTSRLGLNVTGYKVGKTDISAKIEADFYAGLSGSTGTATMRLRQAYMKLGWKDLPMGSGNRASVSLLMGQAWHPMAADQPDMISLAVGAPFNPFNRSPQVTVDADMGEHFTITGSLVYQMQYTSMGPKKGSADYMKYGILPEIYAGLTYRTGGFLVKGGVSLLSIKPANTVTVAPSSGIEQVYKASGRMTELTPFLYLQYRHKLLTLKAKTIYAGAGEYLNLISGYGISDYDEESHRFEYTAARTSTTWLSASYGKKLQGMLMVGYAANLGTSKSIVGDYYFFTKDSYDFRYVAQAYRIVPAVTYNIGKFTVGIEYEMTSAQYGNALSPYGKVCKPMASSSFDFERHWVSNHRIQLMTKFTF